MPNPIIHVLAAITTGYAVGLHHKRQSAIILLLAVLHETVDLDHFVTPGFKSFHNIISFIILPLFLYSIFMFVEFGHRKTILQRVALVFFAMMLSHMALDMLYGSPMPLLYPLSKATLTPTALTMKTHSKYFAFTPAQGVLAFWFSTVALFHTLESALYYGHLPKLKILLPSSAYKAPRIIKRRQPRAAAPVMSGLGWQTI